MQCRAISLHDSLQSPSCPALASLRHPVAGGSAHALLILRLFARSDGPLPSLCLLLCSKPLIIQNCGSDVCLVDTTTGLQGRLKICPLCRRMLESDLVPIEEVIASIGISSSGDSEDSSEGDAETSSQEGEVQVCGSGCGRCLQFPRSRLSVCIVPACSICHYVFLPPPHVQACG